MIFSVDLKSAVFLPREIEAVEYVSSGDSVTVSEIFRSNLSLEFDGNINGNDNKTTVFGPDVTALWNGEKSRRFKLLSVKESIGDISMEELAELDLLSDIRSQANNPSTADEILWRRRQAKVTSTLIESLRDYVEFHKATHPA